MLTKLTFTKNGHETSWANSTDFPTVENNETTVRSDMQLFHNQTQTALNGVIDALEATTDGASGADQVRATAVGSGTSTSVQGILEEIDTRLLNAYPSTNSLSNITWNKEYRLGSISSLSVVLPAIETDRACEIRLVFYMNGAFVPSITATNATILGLNTAGFVSGNIYEVSFAVIGSNGTNNYIGTIVKSWSLT